MEPRPQNYLIYCEKHMPLKLKRILENRAKGFVEEIQLFCKSIDKMLQHKKNSNTCNSNAQSEKKKRLALRAEQQEIEMEIKEENKKIMADLTKFIQDSNFSKLVIELNKVDAGYVVHAIQKPLSGYNDLMQIPSSDPLWDHFRYGDYTSDQVYRLYKRAVRMEKKTRTIKQRKVVDLYEEEMNIRKRIGLMKKLKLRQKLDHDKHKQHSLLKIKIPKHQLIKKEMLYCVCRQPFSEKDDMMRNLFFSHSLECEKCLEWYHLKCVGFN